MQIQHTIGQITSTSSGKTLFGNLLGQIAVQDSGFGLIQKNNLP